MKNISCKRDEIDQNKIYTFEKELGLLDSNFNIASSVIGLIGNEVRLKLVWLIAYEKFCVCDLADILQMSVPAISQHLRKLKDIDIVSYKREKQTLFYSLSPKNKNMVLHILRLLPQHTRSENEKKVC